jgi:hypothetical protein
MFRRLVVLALAVPMFAACAALPEGEACEEATCVEQASQARQPAIDPANYEVPTVDPRVDALRVPAARGGAAESLTDEEQERLRGSRRLQ